MVWQNAEIREARQCSISNAKVSLAARGAQASENAELLDGALSASPYVYTSTWPTRFGFMTFSACMHGIVVHPLHACHAQCLVVIAVTLLELTD